MMKKKKQVFRKIALVVFILLLAGMIFTAIYFYFFSKLRVGDFVYKKTGERFIGEVKGVSFSKAVVQWQTKEYTEERIESLGKLEDLENFEIERILKKNNEIFDAYFKGGG